MRNDLTEELVQFLIRMLRSADLREVHLSLRVLSILGPIGAPALEILIEIIQSDRTGPHGGLRGLACDALGSLRAAALPAVPALCALLLTPRERNIGYVRGDAALALGRIASPDAVTALTSAAVDPEPQGPGECAVDALGNIGTAAVGALPTLLRTLADSSYSYAYKYQVLGVIFRIGTAEVGWRTTLELLDAENAQLKLIGLERATQLAEEGVVVPDRVYEVARMLATTQGDEPEVQGCAARLLKQKQIRR